MRLRWLEGSPRFVEFFHSQSGELPVGASQSLAIATSSLAFGPSGTTEDTIMKLEDQWVKSQCDEI
jgi:hypothetical protein